MKSSQRTPANLAPAMNPRSYLILVIILSLIGGIPVAAQVSGSPPTLEIQAPTRVAVGQPIEITLRMGHAANIAGYETALLFDPAVIEFGGVLQRRNDIKNTGRDVGSLTIVDLPNGAAFGFYSCNFADCVTRLGPENRRGGSGAFTLGRVTLYPTQPGLMEIKFDASRFVDAAGNPVEVTVDRATIAIQVGASGEGRTYPAPGSMWETPGVRPGAENGAAAPAGPFDLTGDGLVTQADVMETAIAWELARLKGVACGAVIEAGRDINHDGCIDVSDIQLVAAQITAAGDDGGTAEAPATPDLTLTVNSTGDEPDDNIGNGICHTSAGTCTLRAAILEANVNPGADAIHFNIPGSGVQTIAITHQLPTLNDGSGGTTIDGYTQPGAAPNTDALVSNATIRVQIEGGGEDNYDGFVITSAGNVIRGLAIYKVRRAFWINGSGAHDNTIIGCFVGTNAAGDYGASQFANFAHGFHIELGANNNYIGGVAPADRNVISGSGSHGVGIWHETSDANVIVNNIIGLTPSGDNRLPNMRHGVDLNYGSSSNLVGGPGPSEHNVISGNDHTGVEVSHTAATTDNYIIGNYIGVDVNGLGNNAYSHNLGRGVNVEDGVSNNVFAGNVIGKNLGGGFEINHSYSTGNIIYENRIGVGVDGSAAGNINYGLRINSSQTIIGPGNIIAFNSGNGIRIGQDAVNTDADFNVITQNSTYSNGLLGIDIYPNNVNANDPGDTDDGANQQLNFPELVSASPLSVTGTVCAGCWVEIFIADGGAGEYGEGMTFVGSTIAGNNGTFTANVSGVASGDYLTATATDQDCNTSEYALNILVTGDDPPNPAPPPTTLPPCVALPPEPTPTATLPPDVTATPTPTVPPDITSTPTATLPPGVTATPTPTATLPPGGAPDVMLYLPALLQTAP